MGCGQWIISSGAAKSYDRSLCDKSTKFGVVMLYFMHFHFRMGTIKNYNDKPPLLTFLKSYETRKPYKHTHLSSTCIQHVNEHENMFVCSKNMFIVNCLYFSV